MQMVVPRKGYGRLRLSACAVGFVFESPQTGNDKINMRMIFRKKKLLVSIIGFALVAFFALSWITNHRTALLSQKNELPAPYNNFNYLYIVSRFSKNSFSRIAYVNQSVQTQAVFQTTPTSASINFGYGIFSDGKGFYEAKEQMEQPIPCGNQQLSATSKLDWIHQQCISVNGKNYIVAGSGTYYDGNPYYVNSTYVIYEQCVKTSFYQGRNKNDCSKYALKVNDTVIDTSIDTSDEGYEHYDNTISSAPKFEDVKVADNMLTYIKSYSSPDTIQGRTEFISYDLSSNTKKVQYSSPDNSGIMGGQLIDGKPVILLSSSSGYGISLGELNGMTNNERMNYFNNYWNTEIPTHSLRFADGKKIDNVRAFASNNGHLYLLQKSTIATTLNNLPSVLLLKDNLAAVEFTPLYFDKFYTGSIEIYPNCKSGFTVCLYNNGDYLVQNENKKDSTMTSSAYENSNGVSIDGSKLMSSSPWLFKPTTYYPNGVQMPNAFEGVSDSPFVFSSNGDTYLVYYHFNTIYGQNVSKGDQPVKLFELNQPVNWDSSDTIYQLRVFPK